MRRLRGVRPFRCFRRGVASALVCLAVAAAAGRGVAAQEPAPATAADSSAKLNMKVKLKSYRPPPLFAAEAPIEITLVAPFKQLRRDRTGKTPYRAGEITYEGDSGRVSVPVRLRTRGIWRRQHCDIPPLHLNFRKDSARKTVFRRLDRVRLALHCRNSDEYEQYVLREFQLYRVQRLFTPFSLDARLARVTYVDSEKRDTIARRYAFLLEEEPDFAQRMGGVLEKTKGGGGDDLDPWENALFGVWQYFIGNTDFSVSGLHNAMLIRRDTSYFPVAYDFDWSGAVNTRYAVPAPQLRIRRVTERVMRGYCADPALFERAFALFREKKDSAYALYRDAIGALLEPDVVKSTLRYFDQFYEVIDDPGLARRLIVDRCLGGRV